MLVRMEPPPADRPSLSDGVVLLRPIERSDIESYVARQDAEMVRRFEWSGPASAEDVRRGVSRWVESWRHGGSERNFAIVDPATGEMIGDCELELRDDGFVNVMYAVFEGWRRRGVATRAVRLLADHAAEVFPGRPLLFRIHPDNEGSKGVARALGAEPAGTERSRHGLVLERWVAT
jgi:RimJ/RimL family protein N-acetyltransferase